VSGTILTEASRQWSQRPEDQRFLSLADLKASVSRRKRESWTVTPDTEDMEVRASGGDLSVEVYDPTKGGERLLRPTNWSFGQLSQYAGAPASYLRTLPAELAAINLKWGLDHNSRRGDALVLAHTNGDDTLRAMTSTSYGRIWDEEVVEAVEKVNHDGRWKVPAASYATANPLRATTLYASDRDVFVFLVDPENPIEVAGESLFRGFYVWNSEVGSAVFGLTTFLYRYVCDNRIVWGATDVRELRIRHTGGAPARFAYEGSKYLRRYAEEDTRAAAEGVKAAQNRKLKSEINEGKGETVADWLQKRGFTKAQARASVETAQAEMGKAESLWDIVNGVTAYARSVAHTDERTKLEAQAGKLMSLAS
jgi:hypothetical protein